MYKSIVFDLGGVMVDFAPRAYLVDRICNEEIEEQVYDLTFGSEEWKQLDAGLVSRFDGNQAMLRNAKAAGREFEVQGVLDDWLHILRPRHRMEELVRRLKSHGYCVYYLSNIPQDVLDLLRDRGVLDAMETAGEAGYRFLPLRVSKTSGDVTGEALATAEQFGKLGCHIQQVLEDICRELGQGAIAADPFWRGPDHNACQWCEYAEACHFEEGRGGDCRRWAHKLAAADFWTEVDGGKKHD